MSTEPTLEALPPMSHDEMLAHLLAANVVALQAMAHGRHPFGAVLVGPDGAVLMRQGNLGTVRHAETELARRAAETYGPEFLWRCTLVSTFEPCAMCAGTQYWAGIGRLVYGMSETRLRAMTGRHPENPTLDVPCREVFARGQKAIRVWGPLPEIEDELARVHVQFWHKHP